ncbi:MFS transporter [Schleiferilactobacillus perolens]|jgi:predicted MFS family arabinose efflux permease|uniref:Transporter major facilitator superfamily MFS 1 n=1 Tax=Schleiferilactobacillus perolens DSM 12744 TaxID=1423792 RepID=A0A0R1MX24_9LACO|nr:MFS transporter [Schleiferilactobacillus perolens]KRL12743.1 transporter major facilitator superfamily MFS 1 [Schleiferilactobacillus perolens DSM 12744]MCI1892047.1 MFS transporter [Schleiferilactobacillus harbinensis]MCI1913772.1 MFS transporter [Schleiferilactobacillus harbinensis]MCI2171355.1 MFS transporter [Schleiferilactobacillus perolens]
MKRKRLSLLFFLVVFIIGTDTFLVSPLLPTLTRYYGITTNLSGFIVSAYALGYTLSAVIVGPISDRHDRRRILLIGMTVFAGATALGGLANTYPLMLAARFLAGLAAAFAGPQVWAAIPLLFPKDQVVKEMGYVTAGLAVAQIIGVPLGSFLAAVSWRFPFFFVGTIALLLTILSARYLPSLNADTDQAPTAVYSQVWHNRPVVKLLFAYFLFQMANFCGFAFIGTWFAKSYSLAISLIGSLMLVIGIGQFIGSLLSSRLVHWLTLPKAFALEFLLFIAGYIVLPIAPSAWLATLILAFIYLIGGAIFPLFMSTLQEQAGETRGTIASLANAAMYLGEAISGGIGGFLIANFTGFYGIAWFTAAGALVAALLYGAQGYFRTVKN